MTCSRCGLYKVTNLLAGYDLRSNMSGSNVDGNDTRDVYMHTGYL